MQACSTAGCSGRHGHLRSPARPPRRRRRARRSRGAVPRRARPPAPRASPVPRQDRHPASAPSCASSCASAVAGLPCQGGAGGRAPPLHRRGRRAARFHPADARGAAAASTVHPALGEPPARMGVALAGQAGTRRRSHLAMPASDATLLRRVRRLPPPVAPPSRRSASKACARRCGRPRARRPGRPGSIRATRARRSGRTRPRTASSCAWARTPAGSTGRASTGPPRAVRGRDTVGAGPTARLRGRSGPAPRSGMALPRGGRGVSFL